jgi:hypothetical protein
LCTLLSLVRLILLEMNIKAMELRKTAINRFGKYVRSIGVHVSTHIIPFLNSEVYISLGYCGIK